MVKSKKGDNMFTLGPQELHRT